MHAMLREEAYYEMFDYESCLCQSKLPLFHVFMDCLSSIF